MLKIFALQRVTRNSSGQTGLAGRAEPSKPGGQQASRLLHFFLNKQNQREIFGLCGHNKRKYPNSMFPPTRHFGCRLLEADVAANTRST